MSTRRTAIGLGLSAAVALSGASTLALSGASTLAQAEDASPAPAPSVSPIPATTDSGRPDLYLDMPYNLGGFEPEIAMTRGEEHIADLAPDDPTRRALEHLVETVGADIDDMVSGYALVSQDDFFSFVVAIRVDGIEPGTLLPAYLPILEGGLQDPSREERQLGGRDVLVIDSLGAEDEYVELFVYDEGDTVWMLQGPTDVVELALENLPDPMATD
ncbi:MAG: hypothetical protein AB1Z63_05315 [Candidatus Limnocylindrales bacterium]